MSATESRLSRVEPRPSPSTSTGRLEHIPGLLLDARRTVYFPAAGILALADLHLGYAWVQRRRGALIPLTAPDPIQTRLVPLLEEYRPRQLVILGDLVHQAVAVPGITEELKTLVAALPKTTQLVVCLGNHDRTLDPLVTKLNLPITLIPQLRWDRYLFFHGDDSSPGGIRESAFTLQAESPMRVIGHEHPAIRLGDGIATAAKVPCFLAANDVLVLPAFSDWAAGCELGQRPWSGRVAREAQFHTAYACVGPRLLRVPLKSKRQR